MRGRMPDEGKRHFEAPDPPDDLLAVQARHGEVFTRVPGLEKGYQLSSSSWIDYRGDTSPWHEVISLPGGVTEFHHQKKCQSFFTQGQNCLWRACACECHRDER